MTRNPDADDVAWALVHAARWTGELSLLRDCPASVLRGDVPMRARWIALAALRIVFGQWALDRRARMWVANTGCTPRARLAEAQRASWWSPLLVAIIAESLLDAHPELRRPTARRLLRPRRQAS